MPDSTEMPATAVAAQLSGRRQSLSVSGSSANGTTAGTVTTTAKAISSATETSTGRRRSSVLTVTPPTAQPSGMCVPPQDQRLIDEAKERVRMASGDILRIARSANTPTEEERALAIICRTVFDLVKDEVDAKRNFRDRLHRCEAELDFATSQVRRRDEINAQQQRTLLHEIQTANETVRQLVLKYNDVVAGGAGGEGPTRTTSSLGGSSTKQQQQTQVPSQLTSSASLLHLQVKRTGGVVASQAGLGSAPGSAGIRGVVFADQGLTAGSSEHAVDGCATAALSPMPPPGLRVDEGITIPRLMDPSELQARLDAEREAHIANPEAKTVEQQLRIAMERRIKDIQLRLRREHEVSIHRTMRKGEELLRTETAKLESKVRQLEQQLRRKEADSEVQLQKERDRWRLQLQRATEVAKSTVLSKLWSVMRERESVQMELEDTRSRAAEAEARHLARIAELEAAAARSALLGSPDRADAALSGDEATPGRGGGDAEIHAVSASGFDVGDGRRRRGVPGGTPVLNPASLVSSASVVKESPHQSNTPRSVDFTPTRPAETTSFGGTRKGKRNALPHQPTAPSPAQRRNSAARRRSLHELQRDSVSVNSSGRIIAAEEAASLVETIETLRRNLTIAVLARDEAITDRDTLAEELALMDPDAAAAVVARLKRSSLTETQRHSSSEIHALLARPDPGEEMQRLVSTVDGDLRQLLQLFLQSRDEILVSLQTKLYRQSRRASSYSPSSALRQEGCSPSNTGSGGAAFNTPLGDRDSHVAAGTHLMETDEAALGGAARPPLHRWRSDAVVSPVAGTREMMAGRKSLTPDDIGELLTIVGLTPAVRPSSAGKSRISPVLAMHTSTPVDPSPAAAHR